MSYSIMCVDKTVTPFQNNSFSGSLLLDNAGVGTITIVSNYFFKLPFFMVGPGSQNFTYTVAMLMNDVDVADISAVWGTVYTGTQNVATMLQLIPDSALSFRHALRVTITSAAGSEKRFYYTLGFEERSN